MMIYQGSEHAQEYFGLISHLIEQGQYNEATCELRSACAIKPLWAQMHFEIIALLINNGYSDLLNDIFQDEMMCPFPTTISYYYRGIFHQIKAEYDAADDLFKKAIKLNP